MSKQIAIVTGGIGDIGTAMCRQLTELGNKVIAACFEAKSEKAAEWKKKQKTDGFDIDVKFVDVTDFSSCQQLASEVENKIGPIAILINNAGINKDAQLCKMTKDQWEVVVRTDLDGLFNMTRNIINAMIERKHGRIINISSVIALRGNFGQTNYTAAKAGVHGFTKSLALEVARYGITVNTVSPGFVESRMVMNIPEKIRKKLLEQIPMERFAKPEEIAWLIGVLSSEKSAYITGANLSINGGLYMY